MAEPEKEWREGGGQHMIFTLHWGKMRPKCPYSLVVDMYILHNLDLGWVGDGMGIAKKMVATQFNNEERSE